jgi:5'-nucleotidase
VDLQFLTISDWHAQLDPLFVFGEGTFGGAAELSAYWDADRAANPNTVTLTAGDAYGGAPPLSGFFDEEPAVRAMRLMGFDVDTLGNHNFDQGISHLQRMITFAGASEDFEPGTPFRYVSANLKNRDDNLTGVEDYVILHRNGFEIAVIGVTNPEAPTLNFPGSFGTIEVTDPVVAAQAARDAAAAEGADVFVALSHLGVTSFDGGGAAAGPIIDFAEAVTGFDLILGDHTNVEFSDHVNGALVVENRSKGRTYARITLSATRNGVVLDKTNEFVDPVSDAVTPDPAIVALLDPLHDELDVLLSGVIGQSTVPILRSDECGQESGRTCESLIGNVVADAMRDRYGTDFAIANAGGLRADLTCPDPDLVDDFCPAPDGGDLEITDGQVLTVLPFGNSVVTLSVTGAELKAHLENGVSSMPDISGRFAQVSGLCFTYDIDAAVGSRVTGAVVDDGTCTGAMIDLSAGTSYTLAENNFTASGGDDYPVDIGSAATRDLLVQVAAEYIAANSPITPVIGGRITCTATGGGTCPTP